MRRFNEVPVVLSLFLLLALALLDSCGGDARFAEAAEPVFRSVPGTSATEGAQYTYQILTNDPGGAAVNLALVTGPPGAVLSGNTIKWTPSSAQSRMSNSFVLEATTSAGAVATQSWSVIPNGTVRVSCIDTIWNQDGSTNQWFDWTSIAGNVSVLAQVEGTFQSLVGIDAGNGILNIPNVPAGYYWLQLPSRQQNVTSSSMYWTSSSSIDLGSNFFRGTASTADPYSTMVNFELTTPAPTRDGRLLLMLRGSYPRIYGQTTDGSTVFNVDALLYGLEAATYRNVFVLQYDPATVGWLNGLVLGPELTMTGLFFRNQPLNYVSGTLNLRAPMALELDAKGSVWRSLFEHVAPNVVEGVGGFMSVAVQPYDTAQNVIGPENVDLLWAPSGTDVMPPDLTRGNCADTSSMALEASSSFVEPVPPELDLDAGAGTVQYNDPFPENWLRKFRLCEFAIVVVPVPGTSSWQSMTLTYGQATALPTAPLMPLISAVQAPQINGSDLLAPQTVNSNSVTLSWSAPAIGAPYGYRVLILKPTEQPALPPSYLPVANLYTAKTSLTVPPSVLRSGNTYLFVVTALLDGQANMENAPNRSALPTARADVISAAISVQ